MAKHFETDIADHRFAFARKTAAIAAEAALDGFYAIRTPVPAERLDDAATVAAYKSLSRVERAFRSLKTVDLDIRPLFHRRAPPVRAHVFLCMSAITSSDTCAPAWHPCSAMTTIVTPHRPCAPAPSPRHHVRRRPAAVDAEKPLALPLTIAIPLAVLRYDRDAATKSGETAARLMSPGSE